MAIYRHRQTPARANQATPQPALNLGRRHRPDYWLLTLTATLLVFGLVVVYSISPGLAASQKVSQNYFIFKQLIDIGLAAGAFMVAASLPIAKWRRLATPLLALAAIGSIVVMFTPLNEIYQAHRWIRLGSYSLQVVELIKLALIIWLAKFLAGQVSAGRFSDWRRCWQPLLAISLIVGFVVAKLQSDLGSAAVIFAIIVLMIYSLGLSLKKMLLALSIVALLVTGAVATSDYRRQRFWAFWHPEANCQTTSYHACQALISVGSGGLFGLGLGYSVQAFGYLPEASNDSIFAIIAEKFGFIGTSMLIMFYGLFIWRLQRLARLSTDLFSRLIVIGVLAWLSTQMIINVGSMLGLLPLKGITLPLISQGGTSIIFLTAALGLVFQISRYTKYNVSSQNQSDSSAYYSHGRRRLRRPPYTAASLSRRA